MGNLVHVTIKDKGYILSKGAYDIYTCIESFGPMSMEELCEELHLNENRTWSGIKAKFRRLISELYGHKLITSYLILREDRTWVTIYCLRGRSRPKDYLDEIIPAFEKSKLGTKTYSKIIKVPYSTFCSWVDVYKRRKEEEEYRAPKEKSNELKLVHNSKSEDSLK